MSAESALRGGTDRPFGLIETLRYEPELGCVRAARHLARIEQSAHTLDKKFNRKAAENGLAAITSNAPLRVRLFLDEKNELSITTHPFTALPADSFWNVAIAATKLDFSDPLLQHKTSLRQVYETARAEFAADLANEVLLTNQLDHICEGTITNLFVLRDETLVTPPLTDGLLRGVLRQELLETGKAVEGSIVPQDLAQFPFFVGNSLRGLIAARLIQN